MYKYLEKINGPEDVKKLDISELKKLANEIREALLFRLSKHGGHVGPNLGTVELEIAMHYVFNSPVDKFVFDVSHQSYTHKILTGRKLGYIDENYFNEDSGYTNPLESKHDLFNIGHTSTSISLASGLAKARDLKGEKENIVAVIGDGSLSGGEALEGLDFVGSEINSNFIIIVNDNQMAIAENHGGLYKSLEELRNTNGTSSNNIFKAFGLDYKYEPDGNNIEKLINDLKEIKDIDHPIVLHINTLKGKGYDFAEENKEAWHWSNPFDLDTGKTIANFAGENYRTITANYLLNKVKSDKKVAVVTAAVPGAVGLTKSIREQMGKQYVDVGIAEEQATAMISGIAKNGGKPVFLTNATFMQRTYDQVAQDICINNNPATMVIFNASVYGMNDVTHLGLYALGEFSNIPNLVVLEPTSKQEYLNMLDWSLEQNEHPVMIVVPTTPITEDTRNFEKDYSNINKFKMEKEGQDVAILVLGDFYNLGKEVADEINASLINPRFASGIDEEMMKQLIKENKVIVTIEDGILDGGFGQKIASFCGKYDVKVLNYGIKKSFPDRYDVQKLLEENRITKKQIIEDINKLNKNI